MPGIKLAPDLSIYYLDFNSQGSKTVLLLHGLGVTGNSWQLQIPPLVEAGFRVLVPDARGFGQSPFPGGKVRIAEMAADFAGLIQSLQIRAVEVAGISMGGTLAIQLALDYPQLVRKLVLVNTFAKLQPDRLRDWLYLVMRFLLVHTLGLPTQAQLVARHLFPGPGQEALRQTLIEQINQADPRGYRAVMRALARYDVRKRLQEINVPVLVITGENDQTVSLQNQIRLVKALLNARHEIIPGAGHAVIVEQAEIFNRIFLDFLDK